MSLPDRPSVRALAAVQALADAPRLATNRIASRRVARARRDLADLTRALGPTRAAPAGPVQHRLHLATVDGVPDVLVQPLVYTDEAYCVEHSVGGRRYVPLSVVTDLRPALVLDTATGAVRP